MIINSLGGKFGWQDGYGAFSYSQSCTENLYSNNLNREKQHKKKSFKEVGTDIDLSLFEFLKKFEVEYEEKYLFEWND